MTFEEFLPYVSIVSLLIAVFALVYQFGRWRQKNDADREEVKKKLETLLTKVDRIPDELMSKSIDMYKMLEKIREDPEATKKRRPKE